MRVGSEERRDQVRFPRRWKLSCRLRSRAGGRVEVCIHAHVREHASALWLINPRDLTQLNDRASPGTQK